MDSLHSNQDHLEYQDDFCSPFGIDPRLESTLCSNFACCGMLLQDLHALLRHYEDVHVTVKDDGGSRRSRRQKRHYLFGTESTDSFSEPSRSAFDTTVITTTTRPLPTVHAQRRKRSLLDEPAASTQFPLPNTQIAQAYVAAVHEDTAVDKPHICTVPGCGKSYKNPNGLKYHASHGHGIQSNEEDKPYKCTVSGCGKRYKNPNGLKYHTNHAHAKHYGVAKGYYGSSQHQ